MTGFFRGQNSGFHREIKRNVNQHVLNRRMFGLFETYLILPNRHHHTACKRRLIYQAIKPNIKMWYFFSFEINFVIVQFQISKKQKTSL